MKVNILSLLTEKSPNKVFLSVVLGGISGVAYAFLIPIVLFAIREDSGSYRLLDTVKDSVWGLDVANYPFARIFFAICVIIIICKTLSQLLLTHVALDIRVQLRLKLAEKILNAPYSFVEHVGRARLIASLNIDVPSIINGAAVIPGVLVNSLQLLGMLGFIAVLNIDVFIFILEAVVFGVLSFQAFMYFARKLTVKARNRMDISQEAFEGLVDGIKELKMDKDKRETYLRDVLAHNEFEVTRLSKKAGSIMRVARNYGDMISFFIIGVISFVFVNYHAISTEELIGVIMALLYLTGPIVYLLDASSDIILARVYLAKINELFRTFEEEKVDEPKDLFQQWSSIRLRDIRYTFANQDSTFSLGPVDLDINRGEITFIVGGNGSGKSTLSKIISLHYQASSGTVSIDDTPVDPTTLESARRRMFAIYSDYYLFKQLFAPVTQEKINQINALLKVMKLDQRVTFEEGKFSTTQLSDGQRRRLALIVALFEAKDCYIFDEWAADQDPEFKEVFYKRVLPELKAKGKAVIVVTHDDRYFDTADKLVFMENGVVVNGRGFQVKKKIEEFDVSDFFV